MARLSTDGIEDFEKKLERIKKGMRGEAIESMLNAGAEVMIRGWQDEISAKGHILTGAMIKSVDKTPIRAGKDGLYIEVYPQGTDSHRINNAQKAFILHYGRKPDKLGKDELKGDKFVTAAEKASKEKAIEAMQAKLNEYIAGKE